DSGRRRLRPEVVGAVDVAVVGDGHGRHAGLLALDEQVLEPGGAVQHGVLGVHVEVRERAVSPVSRRRHVTTSFVAGASRARVDQGRGKWLAPSPAGVICAGNPAGGVSAARSPWPPTRGPTRGRPAAGGGRSTRTAPPP